MTKLISGINVYPNLPTNYEIFTAYKNLKFENIIYL